MNRLVCVVLITFMMGCSPSLPPIANGKIAEDSLSKALQAWKSGDRPDSVQALRPPILFNDQLWANGAQLIDYRIHPGQQNGMGWNCEVSLSLRDSDGEDVERDVAYQIDTQPQIVIVQQP